MGKRGSSAAKDVLNRWGALSSLLLLLVACDEQNGNCTSNGDCHSDTVCNLISGQCIRDFAEFTGDELQFDGTLRCRIDPRRDEPSIVARSDIVGRIDGATTTMTQAGCTNSGDTITATVSGIRRGEATTPSQRFVLNLEFDAEFADGERLTVSSDPLVNVVGTGAASATLMKVNALEGLDYFALPRSGVVRVTGSAEAGEYIELDVDVRLHLLSTNGLGSACTESFDCDLNRGLLCTSMGCSSICHEQAGCSGSGGICTTLYADAAGDFCLAPCRAETDCDKAFHCAEFVDGYGVCAPLDVLGPADEGTLGTRCTASADCAGGQQCVRAEGNPQGVCTNPCTDLCLYAGMQTQCVAVNDELSLCAQVCIEHADCPDDLLCVDVEAYAVCTAPEFLAGDESLGR